MGLTRAYLAVPIFVCTARRTLDIPQISTYYFSMDTHLKIFFWSVFISASQSLKGVRHEFFDFRRFSWISFPLSPEYHIWAISNFYEKYGRYSKVKVDAVGLLFTFILWFFTLFILRCRQSDVVATVSTPVSLLLAINYRRFGETSDKFFARAMKSMTLRDKA
jgi:hypothetical protein